jgi:hypothetical protein
MFMNGQFERPQRRDDVFAPPGPFSDSKLPPNQSTLFMEKGGKGRPNLGVCHEYRAA